MIKPVLDKKKLVGPVRSGHLPISICLPGPNPTNLSWNLSNKYGHVDIDLYVSDRFM